MARRKKGGAFRDGKRQRAVNRRNVPDAILIVCEGEQTEPQYFKSFGIDQRLIRIKTVGTGRGTHGVVKAANHHRRCEDYDQVWCVFDKDHYESFEQAIAKAEKNGLRVAYSNKCFEVWLLAHFLQKGINNSIHEPIEKLREYLPNYDKGNIGNCLAKLTPKRTHAIANAKAWDKHHKECGRSPSTANPSTTVYKLVEELIKCEKRAPKRR